jgi:hypothetical protein
MRSLKNTLVSAATSVLTLGLLTFLAYAQGPAVSAGSFVLPFETRWGPAVLPAGAYTFSLPSAIGSPILTVRGQGKTAMIMLSVGSSTHEFSNDSSLTLIRNGQYAWVQSFDIGHLGTTFSCRPPKGVDAPREIQVAQTVPVKVAKR